MIALDTNLLVRLATGDDPEQAQRAQTLPDPGDRCTENRVGLAFTPGPGLRRCDAVLTGRRYTVGNTGLNPAEAGDRVGPEPDIAP